MKLIASCAHRLHLWKPVPSLFSSCLALMGALDKDAQKLFCYVSICTPADALAGQASVSDGPCSGPCLNNEAERRRAAARLYALPMVRNCAQRACICFIGTVPHRQWNTPWRVTLSLRANLRYDAVGCLVPRYPSCTLSHQSQPSPMSAPRCRTCHLFGRHAEHQHCLRVFYTLGLAFRLAYFLTFLAG